MSVDHQAPPFKKMRLVDDCPEEDNLDEEEEQEVETVSIEDQRNVYSPMCLISQWQEKLTMIKRLTVAIILPSGVGSGQFSLRVGEGGRHLELMIRWPKPLIDIYKMHKKWLTNERQNYKDYHPEFTGFVEALRNYRARSVDWIESHTRIFLPYVVETHIQEKHNLAWVDDTTKMLYVRLRAFVEQYAVENDTEEFVEM